VNARKLFSFLRSPVGLLVLFVAGVFFVLFLMRSCGLTSAPSSGAHKRRQDLQDTLTKLQTGVPSAEFPASTPKADESPHPSSSSVNRKTEPPPLTLYAAAQPVVHLSNRYAPYGRLIKCQLIITVDSSNLDTPIIGLVTEDVSHDGRLVIPAGTEVHGKARKARTRDRIGSENDWILVLRGKNPGFRNGEELAVHGIALDMEEVQEGAKWGITDGSAGMRGDVLKTDDFQEIKLFAATAVSGLARGVQTQTVAPATGAVITTGSARNALFEGAGTVADRYAQMILDSIERDGYFVRVPAGKQFYLYVTETLDENAAKVGGQLRTASQSTESNLSAQNGINSEALVPRNAGEPVSQNVPPEAIPQPGVSPSTDAWQKPVEPSPTSQTDLPNKPFGR
jgi:Bacterial conjugation TrbI-like protein